MDEWDNIFTFHNVKEPELKQQDEISKDTKSVHVCVCFTPTYICGKKYISVYMIYIDTYIYIYRYISMKKYISIYMAPTIYIYVCV